MGSSFKWKKEIVSTEERTKRRLTVIHKDASCLLNLNSRDIQLLCKKEEELNRKGYFERIYPASDAKEFAPYFEHQTYYDILLMHWITLEPDIKKRVAKLRSYVNPSCSHLESKWNSVDHIRCREPETSQTDVLKSQESIASTDKKPIVATLSKRSERTQFSPIKTALELPHLPHFPKRQIRRLNRIFQPNCKSRAESASISKLLDALDLD